MSLIQQPNPDFVEVCTLVAQGDSVTNACKVVGVARRTFFAALAKAEEGAPLHLYYARARKARAESRSDEIDEIIRRTLLPRTDPNFVEANAARVAIDALRWQAGKENNSRYGDKIQVEDATPKPALTREETLTQLQNSGLQLPDIFAALTTRAAPVDVEALPVPESDDDLSGLDGRS